MGIVNDLKQAIAKDGRTLRALARDAGIAPIQISRFVRGTRGLNSGAVDVLCETLGLELRPKRKRKGK